MATYTPILIARFWSKVEVGANSACWMWKGAVGGNGYGRFRLSRARTEQPHRIAWELANAEPLGTRIACHTCDTPLCVNPHHIYAGSALTNIRDAVERGQHTGSGMDQRGSLNPNSRLTEEDVIRIKAMIEGGASNREIARHFPVGDAMVSRIRTGRSWAHLGSSNPRDVRKKEGAVLENTAPSRVKGGEPGRTRTCNQTVMSD